MSSFTAGISSTGDVIDPLHLYWPLSEACSGSKVMKDSEVLSCDILLGRFQTTVGFCIKPSVTSTEQFS